MSAVVRVCAKVPLKAVFVLPNQVNSASHFAPRPTFFHRFNSYDSLQLIHVLSTCVNWRCCLWINLRHFLRSNAHYFSRYPWQKTRRSGMMWAVIVYVIVCSLKFDFVKVVHRPFLCALLCRIFIGYNPSNFDTIQGALAPTHATRVCFESVIIESFEILQMNTVRFDDNLFPLNYV